MLSYIQFEKVLSESTNVFCFLQWVSPRKLECMSMDTG